MTDKWIPITDGMELGRVKQGDLGIRYWPNSQTFRLYSAKSLEDALAYLAELEDSLPEGAFLRLAVDRLEDGTPCGLAVEAVVIESNEAKRAREGIA